MVSGVLYAPMLSLSCPREPPLWVSSPPGVLWKLCTGNCDSMSPPFQKKNLPPEVGVVAGGGVGGGHGAQGIYTAEPISQTRFPLSPDQLCKRWRFCTRNLKQLARVSSLGDACHLGINISLQAGSAVCLISVPSPLCCTFAICRNENGPCASSRMERGGRSLWKGLNGSFSDVFNFLLLLSWPPFVGLEPIFLAIMP